MLRKHDEYLINNIAYITCIIIGKTDQANPFEYLIIYIPPQTPDLDTDHNWNPDSCCISETPRKGSTAMMNLLYDNNTLISEPLQVVERVYLVERRTQTPSKDYNLTAGNSISGNGHRDAQ